MKYVLYMKVISYEKIYEGYFFLKELSNEELFQEELIQNEEIIWKLADTIVSVTNDKRCVCFDWSAILEESQDSQFEDIEYFEIPPEKRIEIEKMEIVQYDNLNKLNLFNKRFENSELDDFIKVFNQKNSQTVQTPTPADSLLVYPDTTPAVPADSVPAAPAAVPVVSAADPVPAVIPTPADSRPKKKPIRPTLDLIKRVADYAARNPGATYKDIAKHFDISIELLRKGKNLRLAVDRERIGNLERHAVKPDKLFNDEN